MDGPERPLPSTPAASTLDPRWSSVVLMTSVLGGLCPLSPIPFIDDLAVRLVRRYQARKVLEHAGVTPTSEQLDALLKRPARGFFMSCCLMLVVYPFKKIFRKVFYFLAVKDCVDTTGELLNQGLLLQYALERKHLSARELASGTQAAIRFNLAMIRTLDKTDSTALNALLRRSFQSSGVLVKEAAASVGRLFKGKGISRKTPEGSDSLSGEELEQLPAVSALADKLAAALRGDDGYLERLQANFEAALREVDQAALQPPEE